MRPQLHRDTAPVKIDYHLVNTAEALDTLVTRLKEAPTFAFDTETTGTRPMIDQLVGISVCPAIGESYYIPVGTRGCCNCRNYRWKQS